jgi:hypothetical protein
MVDFEARKRIASTWGYNQFIFENPYVTEEIKKEKPGDKFKEDYYYKPGDVEEKDLKEYSDRYPWDIMSGTRNPLRTWKEIKEENR